jgi:membrane-associated phospholipid phosphatase
MLSVTITIFITMVINLKFRLSINTAALGGLTGLIIALIFLYDTPLEGFLMLAFVAGGLVGSSRLALGDHWVEVLSGFILGFGVVLATILLY